MRCPDCNKFVGMENAAPEVNNLEVSNDGEALEVHGDVRHVRQCADCSTELKDISLDLEGSVPFGAIERPKELTDEQWATVKTALKKETAEIEIEDYGTEAEESGGGRYAKNMIKVIVNYVITITVGELVVKHDGQLEAESAASEYEECC